MLAITTTFEHIGHWIKMRQSLAGFSGPESSPQIRSLADFIATTSGFSFSVHTTWLEGRADSVCQRMVPVPQRDRYGNDGFAVADQFVRAALQVLEIPLNTHRAA
jgi:hypothetical protein